MLNVLFCGTGWLDVVPHIVRAMQEHSVAANVRVRAAGPLDPQLEDVDIVLPSNAPFGAAQFAAAPRLRLVQQPAAGYDAIDLAAARARDVPVCNTPAQNADSVADAALLLVLALARRWRSAERAFAAARIGSPVGMELRGRSLGIVGLGASGAELAARARALGMNVTSVGRRDGRAGLLSMLSRADFVSVHCPLDPTTRGMFDDEAFGVMMPGACLVNVARGAIVSRPALERALASGRLGGVALDVFWDEPWDPNDALYRREDVLVLPHIAGSTDAAFIRIARIVAANARALCDGEPLSHRVDIRR